MLNLSMSFTPSRLSRVFWAKVLGLRGHLADQGDLVSRLRIGIIRVNIWVIGVIILLAKSP